METSIRKIVAYGLLILVLFFTVISLLGIWDVISLIELFKKVVLSFLVIFAASAVVLFIFTVLIKDNEPPKSI